VSHDSSFIAVALGDYYTTAVLERVLLEPDTTSRPPSRTMCCLKYHPTLPLLAMGDGAGRLLLDYETRKLCTSWRLVGE
jgi:hypothetical protein